MDQRQRVVVAAGVNSHGQREALGTYVGASEDGSFRLEFLRSLNPPGFGGMGPVIANAHHGLPLRKQAA